MIKPIYNELAKYDKLATGQDLSGYALTLRDSLVKTGVEQRINALVGCEWQVMPGGNKRADIKAADFLREMLAGLGSAADDPAYATAAPLGGFDGLTQKIWYGIFYGHAVAECLWAKDGSTIALDQVKVRDRARFRFDEAMRLRLLSTGDADGKLLPARKFWTFSAGTDHDDNPYGLGLGYWLYWPVFFKKNILKFGLIHLEKFASPTATGEYPAELDRETSNEGMERAAEIKAKLLEAVQAVQLDSGIIYPAGMKLSLLEASRGGSAEYMEFYRQISTEIGQLLVGQNASIEGTAGKLGNETLRGQVKTEYLKADADLICNTFNNSVVRWLIEWNFPGAALPKVWRVIEESEDLNARAERDSKIFTFAGVKPAPEYLARVYGEEYTLVAEAAPVAAETAAPAFAEANPPQPPFSKGGSVPDEFDRLAADLMDDWRPVMEPMITPLLDELMKSKSPEEFEAALARGAAKMDVNPQAERLYKLMMLAQIYGRATPPGNDDAG